MRRHHDRLWDFARGDVFRTPSPAIFLFLWLLIMMPTMSTEFRISTVTRRGSSIAWTSDGRKGLPVRRLSTSSDQQHERHSSVASRPKQDDSTLFDKVAWQEYESAIREMVASKRVMGKTCFEDVAPAVDGWLLSNAKVMDRMPRLGITNDGTANSQKTFRFHMNEQKHLFLNCTSLTDAQYEFALRILTYMGDFCAKRKSSKPVLVAWYKLQEAGMVPRENCLSTYLYVLSSFDQDSTDASCAAEQVATFHDALFEPNEKTVTLRIRTMTANDDAAAAEALLESIPSCGWKRLRTYLPILTLYCTNGDMSSALRLYRRMQETPEVIFEPDTYALLLGSLAENGYFRRNAEPIQGFLSGPELFDELAAEMADDMLELNNASARIIYNGFARGFAASGGIGLEPIPDDAEPQVTNQLARAGELVVSRVEICKETAICPRTGAKLRLFRLSKSQRKQVHETLLTMAATQYEDFRGKLEARFGEKMDNLEGSDFAIRELSKFSRWLDGREGQPFTAIVDGPNVAYFGHGDVHYSQVELVVKALEKMNENPLVIMPEKYVAPKFYLAMGNVQELDEQSVGVMNGLLESGKMYTVPSKCLDDYYWMIASVSNQTVASRSEDNIHHVSTKDSEGRFPGLRPMLITNDQMRDHKLELLKPRLFRRWSNGHIVNYNFTVFNETEWKEREVQFTPADFFSREIQSNPIPGLEDSPAWHFPVIEWKSNERLCICIPK